MGRHSAPETDEERPEPQPRESSGGSAPAAVPVSADLTPDRGAVAAASTAPVPQVASTAPVPPIPPAAQARPAAAAGGTRGDLQLLRADTGLMLWCVGAVVLLFLVYTSVLFLIARTDVYLIWVWIPTVLSGMAIGGLLDRAHRRLSDRSAS